MSVCVVSLDFFVDDRSRYLYYARRIPAHLRCTHILTQGS